MGTKMLMDSIVEKPVQELALSRAIWSLRSKRMTKRWWTSSSNRASCLWTRQSRKLVRERVHASLPLTFGCYSLGWICFAFCFHYVQMHLDFTAIYYTMGYILCQYLDDFIHLRFNLGHLFCWKWGLMSLSLHLLHSYLKKWGLSLARFLDTEHDPCALECAVLRCLVIRSLLQSIQRITYLLSLHFPPLPVIQRQRVMCILIWDRTTYYEILWSCGNKHAKKQRWAKQFCVTNHLCYIIGPMLCTDAQFKCLNVDFFLEINFIRPSQYVLKFQRDSECKGLELVQFKREL